MSVHGCFIDLKVQCSLKTSASVEDLILRCRETEIHT